MTPLLTQAEKDRPFGRCTSVTVLSSFPIRGTSVLRGCWLTWAFRLWLPPAPAMPFQSGNATIRSVVMRPWHMWLKLSRRRSWQSAPILRMVLETRPNVSPRPSGFPRRPGWLAVRLRTHPRARIARCTSLTMQSSESVQPRKWRTAFRFVSP